MKQQTAAPQTPATVTPAAMTDPTGTVAFDTSSGISLEEQQEILEVINTITGGSRLVSEASDVKAKKKGFLFPLFVNIAAVVILAAGFYFLSRIHVQDEQKIRSNSADLGLTERKLIQEIRAGANPALDELMQLSNERERAARIESLVAGFFMRVNNQIGEGRLNEAHATLLETREFLNAPAFAGIRSLEAGRQSHLTAISALERIVSDARRIKEEAAGSSSVLGEALLEMNSRYAALEEQSAALSAQGSDRDSSIKIQEARIKEQDARITEQELRLRQLESANINQQETLNRRDTELIGLRNERIEKELQISALNVSLAEQIAQKEELQRQHNDLQARLDAAMRLFQP